MSVTAMALTKGVWTKVATDVQSGGIFLISPSTTTFWHTIRDTGEAAPDAGDLAVEGVALDSVNQISAAAPIDMYIWPAETDGKIRVDLPGVV